MPTLKLFIFSLFFFATKGVQKSPTTFVAAGASLQTLRHENLRYGCHCSLRTSRVIGEQLKIADFRQNSC